jgi:hypothetical protein
VPTPADIDLESDVLVTAATFGSDRWMLDLLGPDDFFHHSHLFRVVKAAVDAGTLRSCCEITDGRYRTWWDGLDPLASDQLERLRAHSAPVHARCRAVERLHELRDWRLVHTAAHAVDNGLSHGQVDAERVAELRAALDRIGVAA